MVKAEKDVQEVANANKYEKITEIKFEGKKVSVRYTIRLDEYLSVVSNVYLSSFTDSGEYMPEMTEVSLKYYIIKTYTDFELPDDIMEAYDIIVGTNLYFDILDAVNMDQVADIEGAVYRRIDKALVVSADVAERNLTAVSEQFRLIGDKLSKMFMELSNKENEKESGEAKPVRKKSNK